MQRKLLIISIAIALAGILFQMGLQWWMSPHAIRGFYFQRWSSEDVMQTVSVQDLRDTPVQALWYNHIHPPALDAIRAVFAQVWSTPDNPTLLRRVDRSLYVLWAMLYGAMGALIFWWLARATRPWFAGAAAALFLLHPAAIFYATLMEATLISTPASGRSL